VRFARIVFLIAGIWGVLVLTPLYFMFDLIGSKDPPPITHPGFYYGFVGAGLAWQIAFLIIAKYPVRLRLIMIPAVIEKFTYGIAMFALYSQARVHGSDMVFAIVDTLLGILFIVAFVKTPSQVGIEPA
jgi:hypothetical protein